MRIESNLFFQAIRPLLLASCVILAFVQCSIGGGSGPEKGSDMYLRKALVDEEIARRAALAREIPPSAEAHYQFMLGELALKEERIEDALEHFEEAEEQDTSNSPTLRRRLSQLYLRAGRLEDALEQTDKALEVDDNNATLLQLRGGILATLKRRDEAISTYRRLIAHPDTTSEEPYIFIASLYAQDNEIAEAQKVLEELVKAKPKSFFGHYYLAKILFAGGKHAQAEKAYKKTLELNPNAESVMLELAKVYAYQKKFEKAIALCKKIVERNPANVKARGFLGELLLGKDQVDDALREFEAMQPFEADPSETRFKVGLIKLQRRDLEGAEVELRLVLAEHPENSAARYYLASAYAGLKRIEEAIEQLRQVESGQEFFTESRTLGAFLLRQDERYVEATELLEDLVEEKPEDIKLLTFYGSLQHDAGDVESAIGTMESIIDLEPKEDRHHFTLGVYQDEAGQNEAALASMRKAIELNPKNANALNYLGYSLAESGQDLQEAERLIKKAISIEKNNGYFIDSLGWVYFRMGKMKKALKQLERAAELVPDDAVILEHLGLAYQENGKLKEARETLEKALRLAPDSDDEDVEQRVKDALSSLEGDTASDASN